MSASDPKRTPRSNALQGQLIHVHRLALAVLVTAAAADALAESSVQLFVAGFEEVWEFRLDLQSAKAELVSKMNRKSDQPYPPPWGAVFRKRADKKESRSNVANSLKASIPAGAKWAEFSPDCRSAVIGYEHPVFDVIHTTEYGHLHPWTQLGELKLEEYNYVQDFTSSPDSKFVVFVETEERYSWSPLGMLGRAIGHPLPLETLFVTTVHLESGKKTRVKLLSDVAYGGAAFNTDLISCETR